MVRRLAGKIDKKSNTVLHYTADFKGVSQPGNALQLQEELHWFERIEKRLPYHYTIHYNKEDNKTAKQLFMEKHDDLLKEARNWIKETAQSCSAVAVLVATVVFTAAYTVPGGTNDNGLPIFLHEPIFLVFTVMDVVALASSMASVIMFLSILTSPCEMWDFRMLLQLTIPMVVEEEIICLKNQVLLMIILYLMKVSIKVSNLLLFCYFK